MDFVYIERKLWNEIRDHARKEDPNECIGFFEAQPSTSGNIRITAIFPCKNVAKNPKHSGQIHQSTALKIKRLAKKNEKNGFVYGMYHSHPSSETIHLSEQDSFVGKVYKRFRHQIVAAVCGKKRSVRMAFWAYQKPHWQEVEIMIKRRKYA